MKINLDKSQFLLAVGSCAPVGFLTVYLWNVNPRACVFFILFVIILVLNLLYPWKYKNWKVDDKSPESLKQHAEFVKIIFRRVHFALLLIIIFSISVCTLIPAAQTGMPEYVERLTMSEIKKRSSEIILDSSRFIPININERYKNHGHSFISNLHSTQNEAYTTEDVLRSITPTMLAPIWDFCLVVLILVFVFLMMALFAELIASFSFGLQ